MNKIIILLILSILITSCSLTNNRTSERYAVKSTVQVEPERLPNQTVKLSNVIIATPSKKIYHNLWAEIGDKSHLNIANFADYKDNVDYYIKNHTHLKRVSKRAEPYLHYILQEVKKRNMPYEMALLPIVESSFLPFAKSSAKAKGLWQIMPKTGKMLGLTQNKWFEGRQDLHKSTNAALNYLEKQYKRNNQDWLLALASYNAGYGNVSKARKKFLSQNPDGYVDYWSIREFLPQETQNYIPKLLAISYLIENRHIYDVKLNPIKNSPFFTVINLDKPVDMYKLAKATDIEVEVIKKLNSGFLKSVTPPVGNYNLLLPVEKSRVFKNKLKKNPNIFDVVWTKKYIVQNGDSLSVIAYKNNTTTKQIKRLNRLKNNNIRIGKALLIPVKHFNKLASSL